MINAYYEGEFLAAEEIQISAGDRSYRYGDGLIETILFRNGRLFRAKQHFKRLLNGAELLKISGASDPDYLIALCRELIKRSGQTSGICRLQLSRGNQQGGLIPAKSDKGSLCIILGDEVKRQNAAFRLMLATSVSVYSKDPLLQIKSANRLPWILARQEATESGYDDALLTNEYGRITESSVANVFWLKDSIVHTPPISEGLLPGVGRETVIELLKQSAMSLEEAPATIDAILNADSVFLSIASRGILPVSEIKSQSFQVPEVVDNLSNQYQALIQKETQS